VSAYYKNYASAAKQPFVNAYAGLPGKHS